MSKKKARLEIDRCPNDRYICFNDVVGRGSYKVVYRAYDTNNGNEVAWNQIALCRLEKNETQMVVDEVLLLEKLSPQNKYIVDFLTAWYDEEKGNVVFITELALGGTLKNYILHIEKINMRVIKKWCIQILKGLRFLHRNNIAHRDLKCNNIFMHPRSGDIVIGDLGLAKEKRCNFNSVIGTPEYMAPEMFDEEYDEKIDIYAFGMCFLEMITKEVPFSECKGVGQIYKKITSGAKPEALQRVKNAKAKRIIEVCLNYDPKQRPSADNLVHDPFFRVVIDLEDDDENLTETPSSEIIDIQAEFPIPIVSKVLEIDSLHECMLQNLDQFILTTTPTSPDIVGNIEPEFL